MTAFEPIIAAILGSGVTAGVAWIVKQIGNHKALKYGPIVARAYDIIDPLAIELAIEAVADGEITANEIKVAAREASARWLPAVAAEKVRKYVTASDTPAELKVADTLAGHVNGIISKEEALKKP
jgi:hypothetical protein